MITTVGQVPDALKERGILYTPENVQKIFRGLKRQTRRTLQFPKKWDEQGLTHDDLEASGFWKCEDHWQYGDDRLPQNWQVGDRLYIKEPHYLFGDIEQYVEHGKRRWKFRRKDDRCFYLDGPAPPGFISTNHHWQWEDRWFKRSPLFMARRDARLITELIAVRVERLQEISKDGCDAEGIEYHDGMGIGHSGYRHSSSHGYVYPTAQEAYRALWESIHGKGSWALNPWVWVLTFKTIPVN